MKKSARKDRLALKAIQEILDGTDWNPEMLEIIADVLRLAGYPVRDTAEVN